MRAVAVRGLQAYAVPSARAGQQTDPSARRDALSGLLAAGFLVAVIVAILLIVIAAPEYAEPAPETGLAAGAEAGDPTAEVVVEAAAAQTPAPTSSSPDRLKGYRWPVRGGMIASYHDYDPSGHFAMDGRRVHSGLVITWFEGALVKSAHAGTVVAAGREWAREVGYDGSLDDYYARQRKKGLKSPEGVVIDDGNGYRSVYTEVQDLRVKVGDSVKAGTVIGAMSRAEGRQMMRYQLVRMDGPWMMVARPERKRGFPDYARERIDPLAVLRVGANKSPDARKQPPADSPRLSSY